MEVDGKARRKKKHFFFVPNRGSRFGSALLQAKESVFGIKTKMVSMIDDCLRQIRIAFFLSLGDSSMFLFVINITRFTINHAFFLFFFLSLSFFSLLPRMFDVLMHS